MPQVCPSTTSIGLQPGTHRPSGCSITSYRAEEEAPLGLARITFFCFTCPFDVRYVLLLTPYNILSSSVFTHQLRFYESLLAGFMRTRSDVNLETRLLYLGLAYRILYEPLVLHQAR